MSYDVGLECYKYYDIYFFVFGLKAFGRKEGFKDLIEKNNYVTFIFMIGVSGRKEI